MVLVAVGKKQSCEWSTFEREEVKNVERVSIFSWRKTREESNHHSNTHTHSHTKTLPLGQSEIKLVSSPLYQFIMR